LLDRNRVYVVVVFINYVLDYIDLVSLI
jgi:hypothetical protein